MLIGIGIGSNLGCRQDRIDQAVEALCQWGTEVKVAGVRETDPVDCPPGSPRFLNTVAVFDYRGGLFELLDSLQNLEQEAGREEETSREKNDPRPLDLDILFCEDLLLDTPRLTLPHPRMMERRFVLGPLAELVPDFRPFPDGPTVLERLDSLS